MDRWKEKVALVTGASIGIGNGIVIEMAKHGMRVIAIARSVDKLLELAHDIKTEYNVEIYPMKCDISEEKDILEIFQWAFDTFNGIDVLVNNAAMIINEKIIGKLLFSSSIFFLYSSFSSPFSGLHEKNSFSDIFIRNDIKFVIEIV